MADASRNKQIASNAACLTDLRKAYDHAAQRTKRKVSEGVRETIMATEEPSMARSFRRKKGKTKPVCSQNRRNACNSAAQQTNGKVAGDACATTSATPERRLTRSFQMRKSQKTTTTTDFSDPLKTRNRTYVTTVQETQDDVSDVESDYPPLSVWRGEETEDPVRRRAIAFLKNNIM